MSDFEGHLRAGIAAYLLFVLLGILLTVIVDIPRRIILLNFVSAPVIIAGAMFPDIDHHASKPHRLFKKITGTFCAGGFLVFGYQVMPLITPIVDIEHVGYVLGVTSVFVAALVYVSMIRIIELARPTHRGITHRMLTGLFMAASSGALVIIALQTYEITSMLPGLVAGIAFFFGFCSHIYMDGMLFKRETYASLR